MFSTLTCDVDQNHQNHPLLDDVISYALSKHPSHLKSYVHVKTNDDNDDRAEVSEKAVKTSRDANVFGRTGFTGWRLGALTAALIAIVSLTINIAVIGWLSTHSAFGKGLVELYRDECHKIGQVNTFIHLAINAVSTLLLGGSNYCMQCLVAPTRKTVDEAHRVGKWLDVGVPSWHNFRATTTGKRILWIILVLSSLPIHLMYNSAFYASAATHSYVARIATAGFVDNVDFYNLTEVDSWARDIKNWQRLSNAECIRAYAHDLMEDRSNVVVVTLNTTRGPVPYTYMRQFDQEIRLDSQAYSPFEWICSDTEAVAKYDIAKNPYAQCYKWVDQVLRLSDDWAPAGLQAEYCLSQQVTQSCGLNANLPIVVIVIVCNAIKCLVMLYVSFGLRSNPLIVVGDAIQSFLDSPDAITDRAGLISRANIASLTKDQALARLQPTTIRHQPEETYNSRSYPRLFAAASTTLWVSTSACCMISIVIVLGLLMYAIFTPLEDSRSLKYLWQLGFGSVNGRTIISGEGWIRTQEEDDTMRNTFTAVFVANLPQLILSILYFNLNSLVTSMCLAIEWAGYSTFRKYLRVSTPKPKSGQRSTYFLSIPYRFGIPMLIVSAALHWLISQSVFLAVISEYNELGVLTSKAKITTCGYSPIAMIFTACLAFLVLLGILASGYPRLKADIPLVSSCSLAISAACHAPAHEEQVALKPVMWGVIPGVNTENGACRCAFSSETVEPLTSR